MGASDTNLLKKWYEAAPGYVVSLLVALASAGATMVYHMGANDAGISREKEANALIVNRRDRENTAQAVQEQVDIAALRADIHEIRAELVEIRHTQLARGNKE